MGYYTRADIPFYYAVADAFTICDNYFCSVLGPTDPNRLYTMAASIDPAGQNGGPILQTIIANRSAFKALANANAFEFQGVIGMHWALHRLCARWRFREMNELQGASPY